MSEFLFEWIVKRRTPQSAKLVQILLIAVCVLSLVFVVLLPYGLGILVVALFIFLTYLYHMKNDIEWEYLLVEKSLFVDKIMKKTTRKRMGEFDLTKTEVMAPENSSYVKEYSNRRLKVMDFSSMNPDNKKYAIIILDNNEYIELLIEPDDRMLKELRNIIPRQLHVE